MKMIKLSQAKYKERLEKITPKLNEIHHGEVIKHGNKMIMKLELKVGAFIGTNYQEYYVDEYIIALKRYIGRKLYLQTKELYCK